MENSKLNSGSNNSSRSRKGNPPPKQKVNRAEKTILISLVECRARSPGGAPWPTPLFKLDRTARAIAETKRTLRGLEHRGLIECIADDSGAVVNVRLTSSGNKVAARLRNSLFWIENLK